ncbi:MFS transporter [Mycoplasmatota bacterium]|nr:MFS transporter [Mycoplasmatota bacterium]
MKAKTTYYLNRSIMGLAFNMMFTATALYRIDIAQLEIYQLILIGTAMELAIFFFEIPTGVVADVKSRRTSIIMGIFIIGIATIVEALTPYFLMIFVAQVIWGFGYTFISGALQSWVSDETQEKNLNKTIITGSQFYTVASIIGILGAALIGKTDIRIALYGSAGIVMILGVINMFFMTEKHFIKTPHQETMWKTYIHQFSKGLKHIRRHRVLSVMMVILLFFGLYSEGIDRTYEIHILNDLDFRTLIDLSPIWILSIINALIVVLGFILMQLTKRYIKEDYHMISWLMVFTMTMIIGILLFGFLPLPYLAVGGFLIFHMAREASSPLLDIVVIKHTPSQIKATVLSTFGQIDAIGQILSGGIMVIIGLTLDIKMLYLASALLLVVPVVLFPKTKEIKYS